MGRGLFIVIEGANRTHKHQLAQVLKNNIHKRTGQPVRVYRFEHRPNTLCPILPNYLQGEKDYPDQVIHHLFSADRWRLSHHLKYLINKGYTVILQRYVASGHAYTIANGKFDHEWCKQFDSGLLKPDVTIYLERDPHLIPELVFEDPDIYETSEMQIKITEEFHKLKEPDWITVDVSRSSPKQAMDRIIPVVLEKLEQSLDGELVFTYYV